MVLLPLVVIDLARKPRHPDLPQLGRCISEGRTLLHEDLNQRRLRIVRRCLRRLLRLLLRPLPGRGDDLRQFSRSIQGHLGEGRILGGEGHGVAGRLPDVSALMNHILHQLGHEQRPLACHAGLKVCEVVTRQEHGHLPVLHRYGRLDQLLDQRQGDPQQLRHVLFGVVMHECPVDLAARDAQVLLILVLVLAGLLLLTGLSSSLVLGLLLLLSAREGGAERVHCHHPNVLHLVGGQDARAGLLQACNNSVSPRLEPLRIHWARCRHFQRRDDAVQELVDQLREHFALAAVAGRRAELAPGLECEVADLLAHREVEDRQQGLRRLRDERSVMLAQLFHERVHAFDGVLEVLHLGSAHDHHLHLAILPLHHGQVDLVVVVQAFPRLGRELLGRKCEFLKDGGKDVRDEGQEVALHREADPLGRLHHVLLDGVVGGQVRGLGRLDHRLHDALCVRLEASRADGLSQQRDAFEGLPQEHALLGAVQHGRDQLLEDRHQRAVVRGETVLHLARDDRDVGDSLLLDADILALQLLAELLHHGRHEGLQKLALHRLAVELEGLHAAAEHPLVRVVQALQELGQQLLRHGVAGQDLVVVHGELREGAPGRVPHADVAGA
mmetsp:Transcript_946/g.2666  ORF Transcript_946/g.2666 Transcript_946/m.2666 type:complete len:612 (+) Transcript_946:510-2345(+)